MSFILCAKGISALLLNIGLVILLFIKYFYIYNVYDILRLTNRNYEEFLI